MVKKSEYIWNSIGSIIASILNAVLLLFCTRINGVEAAGIFSIAFATSIVLNAIGDFGIRVYQVTDSKRTYSFGEYLSLRIFVVFIMVVVGFLFVIFNHYDYQKSSIVILLVLFRVIDNLSECYQAEFQMQGRLDLGGKSVSIRYCLACIVFLVVDFSSNDLLLASLSLMITNLVGFCFYDRIKIKVFTKQTPILNKQTIQNMLIECFPVFLATLLSLVISNIVKYAIDYNGDNIMQTYYNIIYLPAFTINLLSIFIIKPMLKVLADDWNSQNYSDTKKIMFKTSMIIFFATLIVSFVGYYIGTIILSIIYGVDVNMYRIELVLLVISGGFYALSVLAFYMLTTMRKQWMAMISYGVTTIFSIFTAPFLVRNYQMLGASLSNIIINALLCLLLFVFFCVNLRREQRQRKYLA